MFSVNPGYECSQDALEFSSTSNHFSKCFSDFIAQLECKWNTLDVPIRYQNHSSAQNSIISKEESAKLPIDF